MPDHYQTLQVDKLDSLETIKKSFRKLAKKFHPDLNPNDPRANERFRAIHEAYQVLTDPDGRLRYDRAHATKDASKDVKRQGSTRETKSRDALKTSIKTLTLKEIFSGARFYHVQKMQRKCSICAGTGLLDGRGHSIFFTCPYCVGRGKKEIIHRLGIDLPSASKDGQEFKISHENKEFILKIRYPKGVESKGDDLYITRVISIERARRGTRLTLKNIHGRDLRFALPAGTKAGTLIRLGGQGLKFGSSDLFIKIQYSR